LREDRFFVDSDGLVSLHAREEQPCLSPRNRRACIISVFASLIPKELALADGPVGLRQQIVSHFCLTRLMRKSS
jgi:hypothetical protein